MLQANPQISYALVLDERCVLFRFCLLYSILRSFSTDLTPYCVLHIQVHTQRQLPDYIPNYLLHSPHAQNNQHTSVQTRTMRIRTQLMLTCLLLPLNTNAALVRLKTEEHASVVEDCSLALGIRLRLGRLLLSEAEDARVLGGNCQRIWIDACGWSGLRKMRVRVVRGWRQRLWVIVRGARRQLCM